jgi:hypothetical protein
VGEHRRNQPWIKNGFFAPDGRAWFSQSDADPPAVRTRPFPRYAAWSDKPLDRYRHCGRLDTHMLRQFRQACRLNLIQVIQNAGLVVAQFLTRSRIHYVPSMTRHEDARIKLHYFFDRFWIQPGASWHEYFDLSNQIIRSKQTNLGRGWNCRGYKPGPILPNESKGLKPW